MLLCLPASDHDLLQSVPTPFRRKHVLLLPSLKPSKGSSGTVNRTHTCLAMIHEICHNLFFLTLFSSPVYVCLFGYSREVRGQPRVLLLGHCLPHFERQVMISLVLVDCTSLAG